MMKRFGRPNTKCPICRKKVHPNDLEESDIPVVRKNGRVTKMRAILATCCSTLYLEEV